MTIWAIVFPIIQQSCTSQMDKVENDAHDDTERLSFLRCVLQTVLQVSTGQ
jgi:hypothetical protein